MNNLTGNRAREIRAENALRLWEVFLAYKNDIDSGLTKNDLISLADFNMAEGEPAVDVFDRALAACRRRAEKEDMIIPRAVPSNRGYRYVLASRGDLVVDSFLASQRVTQGMQKATYRHEEFIATNLNDLPETEKVVFRELQRMEQKRREMYEDSMKDTVRVLADVRDAARKDRESESEHRDEVKA